MIKVLSEEDNNGEVKRAAFMLITNLAADTTNKIVMLSDALMGVSKKETMKRVYLFECRKCCECCVRRNVEAK